MRSIFVTLTFALILVHVVFAKEYNHEFAATVSDGLEEDDPLETQAESGWWDSLERAWTEVRGTSAVACLIIMLPVTVCFLFCAIVLCIYVKCTKSKSSLRDSTRLGLKSRDGQLDPIPLTGLVHSKSPSQGFLPLRPVVGRPTTST